MTSVVQASSSNKKRNNRRKQLLLKYIIFKSLGPDKYWFQKLNSEYLFNRYATAFKTVISNATFLKDNNKQVDILDVGAGAGILSIFAARACYELYPKLNRLNVTKVEGMKPIAAAVRRFFALHSMEFDDNSSDSDDDTSKSDASPETTFSVESYLSDRNVSDDSSSNKKDQSKLTTIVIIDPFSTILTSSTPVSGGFGSGFLSCLEDLNTYGNLSRDNSVFFPAKAKLHMQLLYIPNQSSVPPMTFCLNENVEGLDLSLFNVFRGGMEKQQRLDYTHMASIDYSILSSPVCFKTFDLKDLVFSPKKLNAEQKYHEINVEIPIIESGSVNAIMYWYSIDLGDGLTEVSYHPAGMKGSMPLCRQGVHLFDNKNMINVVPNTHCSFMVGIDFEQKYPFVVKNINNSSSGYNDPDLLTLYKQLNYKDVSGVSRWHFSMLCDHERNLAYEMALRKVLQHRKDASVLDIGTGTGLLAMMAARCGAQKVVGCELNPAVALVAVKIVEKNNYSHNVEVLSKKSNDVSISSAEKKFDVCVSEILDCGLLGENVLPAIKDARARLLKDDAIAIPHSAKMFGILINLDLKQGAPISILPAKKQQGSSNNNDMDTGATLNTQVFKPFTRGTSRYQQIRLNDLKHVKLSAPFEVFNTIDLASGNEPTEKEMYPYVDCIIENGCANCIALYYDVYLDSEKEIVLTTSPTNASTCWGQAIQILQNEIHCKKNEPVILHARHDFTSVTVDLAEGLDFD
jgi:predicted RNA methylase